MNAPAKSGGPVTSDESDNRNSRISGFYRLDVDERLEVLQERGFLGEEDVEYLSEQSQGLDRETADKMIENAVGVFELPLGVGLNFTVNDRDYAVPMAIEEPSVLAAVSHSAKIVRDAGGFEAKCESSLMIGQIQVLDCPDPQAARAAILEARNELIDSANALHPKMVERGGGAQDLEVRILEDDRDGSAMVVVHLLIDVCDAMGANLINTMAEGTAPRIEELTGGRVQLRILSNLADRRLVHARCKIPTHCLDWKGFDGLEVAEGIEEASRFAELDPYRAATHNKGVMNGMSAVCIATGNDWRALEAGAHAYCCQGGQYRPMATWHVEREGNDSFLIGQLTAPMQLGTVGGPTKLHPTAQIAQKMLDLDSAAELGEVMGSVGLAQNLGALKALATEGIQRGHMSLHARSVAATAGATGDEMEELVDKLIECDEVKLRKAKELLKEMRTS